MILAGDIGGTKTSLALFEWTTERVEPVREESFHSADYQSVEDILDEFLNRPAAAPAELLKEPAQSEEHEPDPSSKTPETVPLVIDAACIGVAGPVVDNCSRTTNLPWLIDGAEIGKRFNIAVAFERTDSEGPAIAQSTFHHFADYNWDPSRGSPDFVTETPVSELPNDRRAMASVHCYVRNVALWLAGRL